METTPSQLQTEQCRFGHVILLFLPSFAATAGPSGTLCSSHVSMPLGRRFGAPGTVDSWKLHRNRLLVGRYCPKFSSQEV